MLALVPNDDLGFWNKTSGHWGKYYPQANGQNQSPINLLSREAVYKPDLPTLVSNYGASRDLDIKNTGRSIVLTPKYNKLLSDKGAVLSGGSLPAESKFELIEIRFHWGKESNRGSEHTINYKSYPMEIQLVHMNTAYDSLQEAYREEDGIAISAMFVQQTDRDNPLIQPVIEQLHRVLYKDDVVATGNLFNATSFLPDDQLRDYWTYKGSLTEPPCSECVTWIIYRYPYIISHNQLEEFRRLRNHTRGSTASPDSLDDGFLVDNFREIQNMNDRTLSASFET